MGCMHTLNDVLIQQIFIHQNGSVRSWRKIQHESANNHEFTRHTRAVHPCMTPPDCPNTWDSFGGDERECRSNVSSKKKIEKAARVWDSRKGPVFSSLQLPLTHIHVHMDTQTHSRTQGRQGWSRSGNAYTKIVLDKYKIGIEQLFSYYKYQLFLRLIFIWYNLSDTNW